MNRAAIAITLNMDDKILLVKDDLETEIIFREVKSKTQVKLIIVADKSIKVMRQNYRRKNEEI